MDHSVNPVYPGLFINSVRECYSQFDDKQNVQGLQVYKQQDADELYGCVLQSAAQVFKNGDKNEIDDLFGIEFESTTTNKEADEPPQVTFETSRKLLCNIQGGVGTTDKVDHMHQGLLLALQTDVEKFSNVLRII